MKRRSLAALLGGCALTGACFNLDVVAIQPTAGQTYTRSEVLASPLLLERVVAGTFVNLWSAIGVQNPWTIFGIYGEEMTSSATSIDGPVFALVREPRVEIANNLGVDHSLMKTPWALLYEANAACADLGGVVEREGIIVRDPVTNANNTTRFLAFAKFVQGISHVYLGLIFDSAAIVGQSVDLTKPSILPVRPYHEVLDSAVKWLEDAIELSTGTTFSFPINEGQWVYNTGFDNQRLAAVAHSYIARALAYGARTPAERLATDWTRVKEHVLLGTTVNFGPKGSPSNTNHTFSYRSATTAAPLDPPGDEDDNPPDEICSGECRFAGLARVDTRIVGPADTAGAYQVWLQSVSGARFDTVAPITVQTPDQRIQEVGGSSPNFKPAYFKVTDMYPAQTSMDTALRGKYYVSFYWNSTRAQDNRTQFPLDGGGRNENDAGDLRAIQDDMLLAVEMDLLLAEAHIRSTPPDLAAAAVLINKSRTLNGELPAVTAAGVPAGTGCVPRRYDGACGDLFDALVYEKRLETYGTGIAFFDARGWGCLLEGTPLHLAPPGTQLDLMGKQIYSYGGNNKGAAKPTNCPLLFRP